MRVLTTADFAGTVRLTRLAARRDRYTLAAWCTGLGLFVAATTAMFDSSLALHEDLVRETRMVATNTGMRLLGLTSGPSVGGYMLHREFVTLAVLAALMSTFAVIRHTRQNEELGRAEMLDSTVVGRYAGLAAGVLVAAAADVVLAGVLGLAIVVAGQPVEGAFLAGASVAAVGLVWVGVAAVTCQLSSTTRGASGMAAGALAVAFVLSGIGNMAGTVDKAGLRVTSDWPAWLSPIGWGQQTRPFGGADWAPLLLAVLALVVLLVAAVVLESRRDVGRGLWPERRGHPAAARSLLSPVGLTWRLQRGAFLGWAAVLTMFGLIFGNLTEQIQGLTGHAKDWWTQTGGTDQVVDAYQVSIIQMAGMFVAIYVVQVLLRMRVDETGGTLESVLASGRMAVGPRGQRRPRSGRAHGAVRGRHGPHHGAGARRHRRTGRRPRVGRPGADSRRPGRRRCRGGRRLRAAALVGPGQLGADAGDVRRRPDVRAEPEAPAARPGPVAVHPQPAGARRGRHGRTGTGPDRDRGGLRSRRAAGAAAAQPGAPDVAAALNRRTQTSCTGSLPLTQ